MASTIAYIGIITILAIFLIIYMLSVKARRKKWWNAKIYCDYCGKMEPRKNTLVLPNSFEEEKEEEETCNHCRGTGYDPCLDYGKSHPGEKCPYCDGGSYTVYYTIKHQTPSKVKEQLPFKDKVSTYCKKCLEKLGISASEASKLETISNKSLTKLS
ncbi:MAG: hypothetical protein IPN20_03265 [Haliscomenobacter sp.]|nr:hypothetical protein [Haliscomenobacter sp.]